MPRTPRQHTPRCAQYRVLYHERNGSATARVCICLKDVPQ